jgi:cardiolipin-specific phospholipase
VKEAESFFIEALEEWRVKMGHEKMNLVGHSLGGYLSVAYALKYPERVSRLILLSPAGVPENPNDTTIPSKEVDPTPTDSSPNASSAISPNNEQVKNVRKEQAEAKQKESLTRRIATHLWEEGMSPFQILRGTMFYGPILVGKYASRRFAHLSQDEVRDMNDYIWHISHAKGSGEYSISHLLGPTVHARRPLVHRVNAVKVPVTFVYGTHDWMDPEGGEASIKEMRKAGNNNGRIYLVPHAGHHVYLDNPEVVDKLIVKELDRVID